MTPLHPRHRHRQDGSALQVLLPGQYLLMSQQSDTSRRRTYALLRWFKRTSCLDPDIEAMKLKYERN